MSYDQLAGNATTLATFKKNVISIVSNRTGVDVAYITIQRMYSGSVILEIQVTSPPNPAGLGGADPVVLAHVDDALASITTSAADTFNTSFQTQYGISSVAAVKISIAAPPPPATSTDSAPQGMMIPIAAAAGGGGICIVTVVVVVIVIQRRRKRRAHGKVVPCVPIPEQTHPLATAQLPEEPSIDELIAEPVVPIPALPWIRVRKPKSAIPPCV